MVETIEDIKAVQQEKVRLFHEKFREALERLEVVKDSSTEVYVNGESEEMADYCDTTKRAVKIRKSAER